MKLFLDCEPELQPNGTYRYALNQVDDSSTGSQGSSVSEQGNTFAINLNGSIVGVKTIDRYRHIIITNNNEITLYNSETNLAESLIQLDAFNFGEKVKIEHRVVRGCEDVIYFYDGINPDRQFNFSRPELYRNNGDWDINLFNLNPESTFPVIETTVYPSGGALELGKYFFVAEVVDENENVIYTSQVSDGVSIVDDEDGGLNINNNLPEVGGVPKTNKNIRVKVTNLGDFPFIRLVVLRGITSDGITSDAYRVGQLIPIVNGEARFTYTGYNASLDIPIDVREVIVPKVIYQTSKAQTQVDERLIRANLIESVRDYSNYQTFASKIQSNYITEDVSKDEKEIITELGGEVKAYGICYVHKDGTISPAFHIPGRDILPEDEEWTTINFAAFTGDDIYLTLSGTHEYISNDGNVATGRFDLNYSFSQTVTEAKLYFPDGIEFVLNNDAGSLFHITDSPPVMPVNIQLIANVEAGNNIYRFEQDIEFNFENRVFKLEPVSSRQLVRKWKVYSTGENNTFGYYNSEEVYNNPPNYCGDNYWGFDADGNSLLGKPVRYHVIPDRHIEPLMTESTVRKIGVSFSNIQYPNNDIVGHFFVSNVRNPDNSVIVAKGLQISYNYNVQQGRYFNNVSGQIIQPNVLNHFVSNDYLFNKQVVNGQYTLSEGRFEISKYEQSFDYDDYFDNTLPYRKLSLYEKSHKITNYTVVQRAVNAILKSYSLPSRSQFRGIKNNSYSSNFNVLLLESAPSAVPIYSTVKNFKEIFQSVFGIIYRRIGNLNQNQIYNGDAFISKLDITNITWVSVTKPFLAQNTIKYEYELIRDLYTESIINANYRHSGTDECNEYLTEGTLITDFIIKKVTEVVDGKPRGRDSICPEFYGYNNDYSFVNKFNRYLHLGYTYNYCSDCLGIYKNRIIFSKKSFNEDLQDNYRVNLANDYVDIPSNKGEIISINYYNGRLLVRTTTSSFFLQPNPQQIQLSETTAYIGTGDFLSIPPQELNVTDIGYAGQQDVIAEVNTEHGLVWVDGLRGKVYKMTDTLEEISRNGMYHWFKENLKSEAVLTYDPEFERILLTSNGFTISYSFKQQGWKSFHSYFPDRYFYNGETFFTNSKNAIWRHNSKNNCEFYNRVNDSVIEITMPNPTAYHPASVQYYAKAQVYNEFTKQWEDSTNVTFNKGWVFNSNQSSGYFDIQYSTSQLQSTQFNNSRKFVSLVDRMHKVSGIHDISVNNSIINRINSYDIQPVNIDYNLPMYKLAYFRDKFLRVRLYFKNKTHRIITNMIDTLKVNYER